MKRLDVQLIDDGVLVPERVVGHGSRKLQPLIWAQRLPRVSRFRKGRSGLKKSARLPIIRQ
jgi:hypothetical protein